jgi:hypothetical protein
VQRELFLNDRHLGLVAKILYYGPIFGHTRTHIYISFLCFILYFYLQMTNIYMCEMCAYVINEKNSNLKYN